MTGMKARPADPLAAIIWDYCAGTFSPDGAVEVIKERYILIDRKDYPFTEDDIREFSGSKDIQAGSGPELVTVSEATKQNPNWVWNAGINMLRIAEWLESRDARGAEKLAARRNSLAARFVGHAVGDYEGASAALKAAIDYAIEQEDKR